MADLHVRDPERARAAHLLRRAAMVATPSRIDELAGRPWEEAVERLLDEARDHATDHGGGPPSTEHWDEHVAWWLRQMLRPEAEVHERLTWFWHTLLTTNAHKVGSAELVGAQLATLRANATGTYRELLHAFVTSGALLMFLDASWSVAANPNENLARELMELFTLGPGSYTEDDVRSAARALAGWVVTDDEVEWRRENAFVAPLLFRGIQDRWDMAKIVDHLCEQPETAVHVAAALWRHLRGTDPPPEEAIALGRWWQDRDLDILALVGRILTDDGAEDQRLNRPRSGLEWFVAVHGATGLEPDNLWPLEGLGQMPYLPPNVGGWPTGDRWLGPGSSLARLAFAADLPLEAVAGGRSGTVDDLLDRCGLHEVSDNTLDVLRATRSSEELPPEAANRVRWWLALCSPEFQLA